MQLQLQSRKKLTFYQLLLKVGYLLMFWNATLLTIKITASMSKFKSRSTTIFILSTYAQTLLTYT